MKKILEFIKIGFKQRIIYRSSTLWALISSFLVLFLQIKLWQVLLASSVALDNRTLLDMVAFLVINLFLISLTTCNAAGMIESLIRDGSVSSNLTRPISFKKQIMGVQIGANLHFLLFTALLPAAVAITIYGIKFPDFSNALLFCVSALLGAVITFEIQYIMGLLAFFLVTVWFSNFYFTGFMTLFGATAIPLWYYPDWLANLCYCLPFRYITYEPILIFLEDSPNRLRTILIQILWIGALFLLEKLVWGKAERKLIVQGG